jgi:hypothetical protein
MRRPLKTRGLKIMLSEYWKDLMIETLLGKVLIYLNTPSINSGICDADGSQEDEDN